MPPRNKRNATSRRHHPSSQSQSPYVESPQHDLLNFDSDTPPSPSHSPYRSMTPAVFELEPPPSDPDIGRPSASIRDMDPLARQLGYAGGMYATGPSESDIDDGGPVSPSTSPPGPSSFGAFPPPDAPHPGRSALTNLAPAEDTTSDESSLARSVGHIRSPVLAR